MGDMLLPRVRPFDIDPLYLQEANREPGQCDGP